MTSPTLHWTAGHYFAKSSGMAPYVHSLTDSRCLQTTESLILDGANSVCSAARHPELWQTVPTVGIFIISAIAMAAWASMPAGGPQKILSRFLVAGFFASVTVGFWAIAFTRADAPLKIEAAAMQISSLTSALELFFSEHQVFSFEDQCLECRPVHIFAQNSYFPRCQASAEAGMRICLVPPNSDWSKPVGRLSLGYDAIHGDCWQLDGRLTCGKME